MLVFHFTDTEIGTFEREALEAHNHYRTLHEAPPLEYSFELRDECRKWAEYLSSTGAVEESRTKNGENLWTTTDDEVLGPISISFALYLYLSSPCL